MGGDWGFDSESSSNKNSFPVLSTNFAGIGGGSFGDGQRRNGRKQSRPNDDADRLGFGFGWINRLGFGHSVRGVAYCPYCDSHNHWGISRRALIRLSSNPIPFQLFL